MGPGGPCSTSLRILRQRDQRVDHPHPSEGSSRHQPASLAPPPTHPPGWPQHRGDSRVRVWDSGSPAADLAHVNRQAASLDTPRPAGQGCLVPCTQPFLGRTRRHQHTLTRIEQGQAQPHPTLRGDLRSPAPPSWPASCYLTSPVTGDPQVAQNFHCTGPAHSCHATSSGRPRAWARAPRGLAPILPPPAPRLDWESPRPP